MEEKEIRTDNEVLSEESSETTENTAASDSVSPEAADDKTSTYTAQEECSESEPTAEASNPESEEDSSDEIPQKEADYNSMSLSVYRQASVTRPGGTVIYKGEDARPYIGPYMFLVADGLGGTGAIRHTEFNADMFDNLKLPALLFEDIDNNPKYDELRKYIIDSFVEFTSIRDCYKDNVNNIKKSGYFGSRIVSAIILKAMVDYADKFSGGKVFEELAAAENHDAMVTELGEFFAEYIKGYLNEISKRCNLYYESRMTNLLLLATTLCATIYHEDESGVDALYLNAGDSRPYAWSAEGLRQVMPDQEGKDGGMTNCISANARFMVAASHARFEKPCVLFNASDGCFDSGAFHNSPLAFEKVLLEIFASSETLDGAERAITDFFVENGTHDDSSTIAMKIFGYDSYNALRTAAAKRLEVISSKYISVFPELLEVDYNRQLAKLEAGIPDKLSGVKASLDSLEEVKEYCRAKIKSGSWIPYTRAIDAINETIETRKDNIGALTKRLLSIVNSHFAALCRENGCGFGKVSVKRIEDDISKKEKTLEEALSELNKSILDIKNKTDQSFATVTRIFEAALELIPPCSYLSIEELNAQSIKEIKAVFDKAAGMLDSLASDKRKLVRPVDSSIKSYYTYNEDIVKRYPGTAAEIAEKLILGEYTFNPASVAFKNDKAELDSLCLRIRELNEEIKKLEEDDKSAALEAEVDNYWDTNYKTVIESIAKYDIPKVDEHIREDAVAVFTLVNNELSALKEKSKAQTELLLAYDEIYYSLINEGDNK